MAGFVEAVIIRTTLFGLWIINVFCSRDSVLFLTLLGFKLLAPSMKSIGSFAKYTLLAIWIIAIALTISIGIKHQPLLLTEE
jgi:hypothetical protein